MARGPLWFRGSKESRGPRGPGESGGPESLRPDGLWHRFAQV